MAAAGLGARSCEGCPSRAQPLEDAVRGLRRAQDAQPWAGADPGERAGHGSGEAVAAGQRDACRMAGVTQQRGQRRQIRDTGGCRLGFTARMPRVNEVEEGGGSV